MNQASSSSVSGFPVYSSALDSPALQDTFPADAQNPSVLPTSSSSSSSAAAAAAAAASYPAPPMPPQTFVSPSMWQSSVASVYEGGQKRGWDFGNSGMISQVMKRPAPSAPYR